MATLLSKWSSRFSKPLGWRILESICQVWERGALLLRAWMICLVRTYLIFGIWLLLLRYLTPSPLSTGYRQEGGSSSKVMVFRVFKLRLAIPTCSSRCALSFLNGWNTICPLHHMQWQQSAEKWAESVLFGMMTLFDFANHIPSIPGCMQHEKHPTKSWYYQSCNLHTEIVEFTGQTKQQYVTLLPFVLCMRSCNLVSCYPAVCLLQIAKCLRFVSHSGKHSHVQIAPKMQLILFKLPNLSI